MLHCSQLSYMEEPLTLGSRHQSEPTRNRHCVGSHSPKEWPPARAPAAHPGWLLCTPALSLSCRSSVTPLGSRGPVWEREVAVGRFWLQNC